jgi:hypothetical protein
MNTNYDEFVRELTKQYERLFVEQPSDYAYAARLHTPASLAEKMTASLLTATANKDGLGIKRTCKALGIPYTYKAIEQFLMGAQ